MIFVTVGTMVPFDRLVRAMDGWAAAHPDEEMLAQIGDGRYLPRHMRWERRLARPDFDAAVAAAKLIVSHAGIGTMVSAGERRKPIVVLPRQARLGEHSNDHQLDSVRRLGHRPGIFVAEQEADIAARIAEARAGANGAAALSPSASPELLERIRAYILG